MVTLILKGFPVPSTHISMEMKILDLLKGPDAYI